MRLSQTPPPLISLLIVLSNTHTVKAGPYPKDDLHDIGFSYLQDRDCYLYCGENNRYCCSIQGQACYTNAQSIAYCSIPPTADAGGYVLYTSVYTETDFVLTTSTYSSWYNGASPTQVWVPAQTSAETCAATQFACGAVCCTTGQQTCLYAGKCQDISTVGATSTYSAPVKVTSGALTTTSLVSVTTTEPFQTPATATGSSLPITVTTSKGLSGGAIAGIVIGVIAGIILLLLICFCCILRAGFDGLLALFGLGPKRRRSTERIETVERYSRHGSGSGSRRDTHTGWFGGAARPTRVTETRKKSSGFGGLGAVGAGLVGLAVILGLKRRHDRKEKPARSDISSSYYTDSYTGTSASSASSDRRTRESRRDTRRH